MPRKKESPTNIGQLYPKLDEAEDEKRVQRRAARRSSTNSDESEDDDVSDINENQAEDQPKFSSPYAEARRKLHPADGDNLDSPVRVGTPRRRPSIRGRSKSDPNQNAELWWSPYLFVGICIVLLVAATIQVVRWIQVDSSQQRFHKKIEDPWKVFTDDLRLMRDSNLKVLKDIWPVILSAFREILHSAQPSQPGILVLLYDDASVNMKDAFLKNLTLALKHAFEQQRAPLEFYGETYAKASDANLAKKHIDQKFRTELDPLNSRIAFFHDVNLLPSEAALLFISYADHQNAPVKDLALILTLKKNTLHTDYSWDRQAELLFESAWSKDLKSDTIAALQSRLAVNVVAI